MDEVVLYSKDSLCLVRRLMYFKNTGTESSTVCDTNVCSYQDYHGNVRVLPYLLPVLSVVE